jgi:DNA-binding winged helix-turn-helix (wHTH) protein
MVYRFGVFSFDDRALILTRGDRDVALEPQPARALALLVARAGDLVSREELRSHLWAGDTHVDYDRGLAYCIGQLRLALGDSGENPRFIQTLPRRGFRFIAPVQGDLSAPAAAEPPSSAPPPAAAAVPNWIAAAAIAAVALVVGAAGALMLARDRPPASPRPIVAVAQFENETGDPAHAGAMTTLSDTVVERLTAIGPSRLGVNGHAPILRRPRSALDWRAVARETGAAYLVSGQLQMLQNRLSLLMQLVRLDDGTHVWVQRIWRPPDDPLDTLAGAAAADIDAAVRRIVLR